MPAKLNFSLEKQNEIGEYAANHTLQETADFFGISINSVIRYKRKIGLVKAQP